MSVLQKSCFLKDHQLFLSYNEFAIFRKNIYKGQKQKWFLAKLVSNEKKIKLNATRPIEFDNWLWSTYWYPLSTVVDFKREVYREALISILPEYNKQTSKA